MDNHRWSWWGLIHAEITTEAGTPGNPTLPGYLALKQRQQTQGTYQRINETQNKNNANARLKLENKGTFLWIFSKYKHENELEI